MEQLSRIAGTTGRFSVFDLKADLPYLQIKKEENCFDMAVAAYLLDPLKSHYGYEDVAREHLGLMIEDKSELYIKVCYEAYTAREASDILMKRLEEAQMDRLFMEIEMPLVFTLFDMEQNGVKINSGALKEYGDQLAVHISMLEQEIYDAAGETFNINSPKQLGVILFEKLKIPAGKRQRPVILQRQMCWKSWRRIIRLLQRFWNTGSMQSLSLLMQTDWRTLLQMTEEYTENSTRPSLPPEGSAVQSQIFRTFR